MKNYNLCYINYVDILKDFKNEYDDTILKD